MNTRHFAPGLLTLASCLSTACAGGPEPVPPPPVPAQSQCPAGFGPLETDVAGGGLEDGCYAVLESNDWMGGEDACEQHLSEEVAAHLVVVDRPVEHQVLSELSLGSGIRIWTGRFQRDPDDDYRNVNYVEWDTEYFGQGEPNDYAEDCDFLGSCYPAPGEGDERCINYKYETGMWNDEVCFDVMTVICEWDGVGPLGWRPYADRDEE